MDALRNFLEAFFVARYEDQAQPWMLLAQAQIAFDRVSLFRILRATGDEHDIVII